VTALDDEQTSELARRLGLIEDRLAIAELVSRYGILLDNREYDAVGELFTEDAHFWQHVGDTDARTRQGSSTSTASDSATAGPSYHCHHGHVVTFDGDDAAHGIVTAHAEMGIEGRMILVGLRYHDRYERGADGAWRFAEREIWFHYFMPADELPSRYGDEIRRTWPGQPLPADLPDSLESYRSVPHAPYTPR
jgi:hypothetical protein